MPFDSSLLGGAGLRVAIAVLVAAACVGYALRSPTQLLTLPAPSTPPTKPSASTGSPPSTGGLSTSGSSDAGDVSPAAAAGAPASDAEPNPPTAWEGCKTVLVFDPSMPTAEMEDVFNQASELLNDRTTGHFTDLRLAVLFKPGTYSGDFLVGYYTQVLGLGRNADDVEFTGAKGVYCRAMDREEAGAGSLDTFWRSAENFKSDTHGSYTDARGRVHADEMMWAVSQAAPLRRLHVAGDLRLHEGGYYASGGFMANMQVDGRTIMGSQQQWMTRSSSLMKDNKSCTGWLSFVYVGTTGAPDPTYPTAEDLGPAYIVVDKEPVSSEKPFITIDDAGLYHLNVPKARYNHSSPALADILSGAVASETSFDASTIDSVPFSQVFVASATYQPNPSAPQFGTWTTDTHAALQGALDAGKHVVLSPGIYHLGAPLTLHHPGQVLLGIGMATLVAPVDGSPCIRVAPGVPGVRVAGVMLQAAHVDTPQGVTSTMLEWGQEGVGDPGIPTDPGFMFDIFARVGGPDDDREVSTDVIMRLHSGNVVGDNLWLWRADHSKLAPGEVPEPKKGFNRTEEYHLVRGEFKCDVGLDVRGDDVTMYGLAVEHTLKDLVSWRGDRGKVYFYQSELAYDISTESYGAKGYVGYRVHDSVQSHEAHGVGVYSIFRDAVCAVPSAIAAPADAPGVRFHKPFTARLAGERGLRSVINGLGVEPDMVSRVGRLRRAEEGGLVPGGPEVAAA